MENVSQIIKKHNKRVTKLNERSIAPCNCREKKNCPMNGNCRVKNVVYKVGNSATTTTPCHSEIRNAKMTQPFQLFYGSLRNQQKKPLILYGQF